MQVIGNEAIVVGRVFIGGMYQALYTLFRRCIFVGCTMIQGPGNQFIDCQFVTERDYVSLDADETAT